MVRDEDGVLDGQGERVGAVEVFAICSHDVEPFRIAGVDEGAVEDVTCAVRAGAVHRLVNGGAKRGRHRNRLRFKARSLRELTHRHGFDLGFTEVVSKGEFDDRAMLGDVDEETFIPAAVLRELLELVERNQDGAGRTFGGMFETHGDKAVKIGAGKGDPAVVGAFDFDVLQKRQSAPLRDHFADSREGGFKLRDWQWDGVHVGVWG